VSDKVLIHRHRRASESQDQKARHRGQSLHLGRQAGPSHSNELSPPGQGVAFLHALVPRAVETTLIGPWPGIVGRSSLRKRGSPSAPAGVLRHEERRNS